MNYLSHLESALSGKRYEAGRLYNCCPDTGRPLWVRYDLEALKKNFPIGTLAGRPQTLWRYREMLPITNPNNIVSLSETVTPLLEADRLASRFGLEMLLIKDESRLPTGSFKARGMAIAVSMAKELGVTRIAVPSAGNAGGAMAAYAARAGMEAFVFMPDDAPAINIMECLAAGARTVLLNGLISDCGAVVAKGKETMGWFDLSTLKEPYRIEGKKTMGLELAEQLDWQLPDVILYPTGGGTGLIGMWKAFSELEAMGWLKTPKKPKMIACQSAGCAPIARAFEKGERFAQPFPNPRTIASGLRVPSAIGDFMILDAVRESGGVAIAAREAEIPRWMRLAASMEGISLCPEAAVCLGALEQLIDKGTVNPDDKVVLFNTGASQKYPETIKDQALRIDLNKPIDWEAIRIRSG